MSVTIACNCQVCSIGAFILEWSPKVDPVNKMAHVVASDLYSHYVRYACGNGEQPASQAKFGRVLRSTFKFRSSKDSRTRRCIYRLIEFTGRVDELNTLVHTHHEILESQEPRAARAGSMMSFWATPEVLALMPVKNRSKVINQILMDGFDRRRVYTEMADFHEFLAEKAAAGDDLAQLLEPLIRNFLDAKTLERHGQ